MASHDLQLSVEGGAPSDMHGAMNTVGAGAPPPASGGITGQLRRSAHPTVLIFHVLFKLLALALYILGGVFAADKSNSSRKVSGSKFIAVTVGCILLLAADFWVVKNITGRLLVGLRWWNQVEGETTRWIFESKGQEATVNPFDRSVFWTVLYATPVIWCALFVIALLKFELGWLLTVVMAIALSGANVYGYYKCSTDQKDKFQQMMRDGAQQGAMAAMRSNLFGMLLGGGAAGPAAAGASQGATTTYV
mmetsp:Transcript_29785/g.43915  ORF Transcript_29785/g.43915 Transcript_29785/m.43915 type:complete len:249 (-) Transcript_29785:71-817(-)|eukprot:CAMPEP_0194049318 /NCGR_PEP_ID=MMETSP0009_2-20130614/30341_1 /TAXON_ID=210454 /ORGANISM="Grammatophora oceanica, Strain CCMP 410" /LENGTH=248 /DNA_ID=CAMNT_0038695443 /DNA_START=79 /DNA_END=825 /DNA_ORIENTATION=+